MNPTIRKCKNKACNTRFEVRHRHPLALGCCNGCEMILAKQFIEKVQAKRLLEAKRKAAQDRKETKLKLEKLRTLSYWLKRTEKVFNCFIRERDYFEPCISCGSVHATWDAGHYVAVGANGTLRFNEDNVHKQCVYCNQHKSGNSINYRFGLVKKLGLERLGVVEGWHAPRKLTIPECQALEAHYNAKYKALKAQRELDLVGA